METHNALHVNVLLASLTDVLAQPYNCTGLDRDRTPYLTTLRTGKPSLIPAYNNVSHNFFISNYNSFDGQSASQPVFQSSSLLIWLRPANAGSGQQSLKFNAFVCVSVSRTWLAVQ
jgi:hypothetical protein